MRKKNKRSETRARTLGAAALLLAATLTLAACALNPDGAANESGINVADARAAADAANARLTQIEARAQQATADASGKYRATESALRLQGEKAALEATRTANEHVAQATAIALDALASQQRAQIAATAQAADLTFKATTISVQATATAIAIAQENALRSAEWERTVLIPAKTVITAGVGLAVAVIVLYLLVRFGFKMIDTWILHARVFRDGRGNVTIVTPADAHGEMQFVQPHLSPAPVINIARRGQAQVFIEASGGDPDVTRRAQIVDAAQLDAQHMHASPTRRLPRQTQTGSDPEPLRLIEPAIATARAGLDALMSEPRVNVVAPNAIPSAVADVNALAALDSDWRSNA